MSELKPCPFCGGEAIVINPRLRSYFETLENATMRVACPCCGAGISFGYLNERWDKLTEEQAKEAIRATISAWNRRAQPANEPLTMEELREMDGEPVWTVNVSSTEDGTWEMWDIVEKSDDEGIEFGYSTEHEEWWNYNLRNGDGTLCGCSWLAYRRKPERSENG